MLHRYSEHSLSISQLRPFRWIAGRGVMFFTLVLLQLSAPSCRKLRPSLPAKREEAEVQQDGKPHAEQDTHDYPEQATPTQRRRFFWLPSPLRTLRRLLPLPSTLRPSFGPWNVCVSTQSPATPRLQSRYPPVALSPLIAKFPRSTATHATIATILHPNAPRLHNSGQRAVRHDEMCARAQSNG